MGRTTIEWTATVRADGTVVPGYTHNHWLGCSKIAPGCKNCYAEALMDKRYGKVQWGPNGTRVFTAESNRRKPLAWDRAAAAAGERHRVFCSSLSDVFEDWQGPIVDHRGERIWTHRMGGPNQPFLPESQVPEQHWRHATMDDLRADLFRLIDKTPNLDWLLLTKRPENVRRMVHDHWTEKVPGHVSQSEGDGRRWRRRENVWIGTSVSDQQTADAMVPRLLECQGWASVLFLSVEPLIGPIRLRQGIYFDAVATEEYRGTSLDGINWVIVGGESGGGRRPMELEWARSIRDQCEAAKVPFFMKQIDKIQPIPDDLMIREFPQPNLTEPATA